MNKPILEDLLDNSPGVEDHIRCPVCDSREVIEIGILQPMRHHRCRDCGSEFGVTEVL